MATPFADWLASLGSRRANLPPAVRGLAVVHNVSYTGDVSAGTLAGSIKASPDATTELAVFSVASPVFADGVTTWQIGLTGLQTGAMPADIDGSGVEYFVYDFLLTIDGNTERLFGGLFALSGFVTEP